MKLSFMISNLLSEIVETIASHLKKKNNLWNGQKCRFGASNTNTATTTYLEYETGKIILFWDILWHKNYVP